MLWSVSQTLASLKETVVNLEESVDMMRKPTTKRKRVRFTRYFKNAVVVMNFLHVSQMKRA